MRLEVMLLIGFISIAIILFIVAVGLMIYYRDELMSAMQYEELGDGMEDEGILEDGIGPNHTTELIILDII